MLDVGSASVLDIVRVECYWCYICPLKRLYFKKEKVCLGGLAMVVVFNVFALVQLLVYVVFQLAQYGLI